MITAEAFKTTVSAGQALAEAREFITGRLTALKGPRTPWRTRSPLGGVWVVAERIAYPGQEQPGTVDSVERDNATGNIVARTLVDEVLANAELFREHNAAAIAAGFDSVADTKKGP